MTKMLISFFFVMNKTNMTDFFFVLFFTQIQFVAILVYIISALYIDCGFSRNQLYLTGVYLVTLIVLFSNFYIQSYLEKNKKSE